MLIGPAEELGDGDDDPEWQETQRNADESARLTPDKRMIPFMKLSSIQIGRVGAPDLASGVGIVRFCFRQAQSQSSTGPLSAAC
jgi:hypothetical protein